MPLFTVRAYVNGKAQKTREVEAADAHQAAERACGEPLAARGHVRQLRAVVWEFRIRDATREAFYAPE
jgi:hypothetical protein